MHILKMGLMKNRSKDWYSELNRLTGKVLGARLFLCLTPLIQEKQ